MELASLIHQYHDDLHSKYGSQLLPGHLAAILHTHNRRLDYHPHIHVVMPGGGVDKARKQWKKKKTKYLFNEFALA